MAMALRFPYKAFIAPYTMRWPRRLFPGRSGRWCRRLGLALCVILALGLLWTWSEVEGIHERLSNRKPSPQLPYGNLTPTSQPSSSSQEPGPRPQRVFISSIQFNSSGILRGEPKSPGWNAAVLELARHLGSENVFVSVLESSSQDDTPDLLRKLGADLDLLGVDRQIVCENVSRADVVAAWPGDGGTGGGGGGTGMETPPKGWIRTPRHRVELRRIPYLADLRNRALEPLRRLALEEDRFFDKVLFLNDITFSAPEALELLATNGGEYAAACALDFLGVKEMVPTQFYDTWVVRDSEAHVYATNTWPYFRSRVSREALMRNEPVPVRSCWNGMVAMPAYIFLPSEPDSNGNSNPGLTFRAIPDSLAMHHLEGSECCLIHADSPLTSSPEARNAKGSGIFLNTRVRVGYGKGAWDSVHTPDRVSSWVDKTHIFLGIWRNRLVRWMWSPKFDRSTVEQRLERWKAEGIARGDAERVENGVFCLTDDMQVLVEDGLGWVSV